MMCIAGVKDKIRPDRRFAVRENKPLQPCYLANFYLQAGRAHVMFKDFGVVLTFFHGHERHRPAVAKLLKQSPTSARGHAGCGPKHKLAGGQALKLCERA